MNEYFIESPKAVQALLPLTPETEKKIVQWREEIVAILEGRDPRLLLIIGPCSIHNRNSGLEYAKLLKKLSEQVKDQFFIVMRTYFEKARTELGWKGFLYDPDLNNSYDITSGIFSSRAFLLDLAELGLPAGCEFLDPLAASFISDLISWGSIGARTCQSQIHRQLASSLPMPVGIKNFTDGNVEVAIQSLVSAKAAHSFLAIGNEGKLCIKKSSGNIFPHIVLRGGRKCTNFDKIALEQTSHLLKLAGLAPSILVDCSHGNSQRNYLEQKKVFSTLIEEEIAGLSMLRGIMLESNLLEDTQQSHRAKAHSPYSLEEIAFGASLTDPCLNWQETVALVLEAHRLKLKNEIVNNEMVKI